jgi:ribosome maturation factor RimP
MGSDEDITRLVAPLLPGLGLELVDVEARPGLVRVTVDRPGGVDLDALAQASEVISAELDRADVVPGGPYELEVSSPGLERRLRTPAQFARALGAEVAVRTLPGVPGDRRVAGVLEAADEDGIVLVADDLPDGRRRVRYEEIERAHTVFDWRAALAAAPAPPSRAERRRRRRGAPDETGAARRPRRTAALDGGEEPERDRVTR